MDKTICGIDVSKDRLGVAVRPSGERFVVARTGAGLDDLVGRLKVLRPDLVVLEATGGFETVVVAGLAGASLPVAVANPAQIRAFAKAIGQRAKTDPIDADLKGTNNIRPRRARKQATLLLGQRRFRAFCLLLDQAYGVAAWITDHQRFLKPNSDCASSGTASTSGVTNRTPALHKRAATAAMSLVTSVVCQCQRSFVASGRR
jgi:hypothetical protein